MLFRSHKAAGVRRLARVTDTGGIPAHDPKIVQNGFFLELTGSLVSRSGNEMAKARVGGGSSVRSCTSSSLKEGVRPDTADTVASRMYAVHLCWGFASQKRDRRGSPRGNANPIPLSISLALAGASKSPSNMVLRCPMYAAGW